MARPVGSAHYHLLEAFHRQMGLLEALVPVVGS